MIQRRFLLLLMTLVVQSPLFAQDGQQNAPPRLTAAQTSAAIDAFEAALKDRWAYLLPSRFELGPMLAEVRKQFPDGAETGELGLALQAIIGRGIDGHAGVGGYAIPDSGQYLPFVIEPIGERFVAFKPERSGFVSEKHPFVEALDGRPISVWIEAASKYIPDGSPQLVRLYVAGQVRSIQFLRRMLEIEAQPSAKVTFVSPDGAQREGVEIKLSSTSRGAGIWPPVDHQPTLPEGIAYFRLPLMTPGAATRLAAALEQHRDARGLIIDVRDNGGGSRDALRTLAGYVMRPDAPPKVVNAAVARLHPDHDARRMSTRFLYPEDSPEWTPEERAAIASFKRTFKPEWNPPADAYGPWHYLVLRADKNVRHYDRPIVILMNDKCFSATDIFLSAMRGMPGITLVGTPSGGGSANSNVLPLADTPLHVRLATMISFQSDGKLYDTHGVEPDVKIDPMPEYFIGGRDNQLEHAVSKLQKDAK